MKNKQQLPKKPGLSTDEKGLLLARLLDEKQGEEIVLLDVAGVCPIAEQIIMVTGKGQRHVQALADALLHLAKERSIASLGVEGYQTGTWILLDFNDIIVHVFQEDLRGFYNIEGLWSEGRRVAWNAPPQEAPKVDEPKTAAPKAAAKTAVPKKAAPKKAAAPKAAATKPASARKAAPKKTTSSKDSK